jgi:copper chaperone CopZ
MSENLSACSVCGTYLAEWSERVWPVDGTDEELSASPVTCRECAEELAQVAERLDGSTDTEKTVTPEGETVTEQDTPETPETLSADAPPGDTYGTQQAAQVLGVSPRRVSQLAQEGRLDVVQDKPLRVSAQSVHELRAERSGKARHPLTAPPPESVADQVERLVALVTAEQRRAIEAGETLLSEVSRQRDEMRSEVERLRAENDRLRDEQREQKPRRWWRGN